MINRKKIILKEKNNPETISPRIIFPGQMFYKGIYKGTIRYKGNNKYILDQGVFRVFRQHTNQKSAREARRKFLRCLGNNKAKSGARSAREFFRMFMQNTKQIS